MSLAPTVRPRREEDLLALEDILWAVHRASGYPAQWPQDPAAFIAPLDDAARRRASREAGDGAWVAELEGQVVGQVLLRRPQGSSADHWTTYTGHPAVALALVSRLFVHPDAAGRGAAGALLNRAVEAARQQQLTPALEVYAESRRAIRLYEYLGWRRTAEYTGEKHWRGQFPTVYVYLAPDPAP